MGDGSVTFRVSQKVYDMCVSYRPIGNQWWSFDMARNALEGCKGPLMVARGTRNSLPM